jgi:hypothetical protein
MSKIVDEETFDECNEKVPEEDKNKISNNEDQQYNEEENNPKPEVFYLFIYLIISSELDKYRRN